METNYNFEEIWKQKTPDVLDITEIQSKADAYRKKQMLASICLILSLFMTLGVVVWVWFRFLDLHLMTKSGIILVLIALVLYIFQNFQKMKAIRRINPALNSQEYLTQMKILQRKDLYMQTKGISIYYSLLSLGMALYLFEFAKRMEFFWGIFIYVVTFGWILFGWFYIKPRTIRKQQQKMKDVISSLEKVEEGFKN